MNGIKHVYVPIGLMNFEPEPNTHLYILVSKENCPLYDHNLKNNIESNTPKTFCEYTICYERKITDKGQVDYKCPLFHSANNFALVCNADKFNTK